MKTYIYIMYKGKEYIKDYNHNEQWENKKIKGKSVVFGTYVSEFEVVL